MLEEGVNDPAIFKAVFLAGGPGSGKSFIVGQTALTSLGLKLVNSDDAFEVALKKAGMAATPDNIFSDKGQALRHRSKKVTARRQDRYIEGRLGLVIDGTGKDYAKIEKQKKALETLGYETMMILVNTDEPTAQARNKMRDRTLPDAQVKTMWSQVQNNIGKFQNLFGQNFIIVDNSEGSNYKGGVMSAYRKMMRWTKTPPANYRAKKWISAEKKARDMKEGKNHSWKSTGHYTKDGKEWSGPQHAHNGQVMTGEKHTDDSENLYHFKDLSPEVKKKLLDKMKLKEVMDPDAGIGDYIKDFRKSDSPQFRGKSKAKRRQMAIAAYLAKKRKRETNEEVEQIDELSTSTLKSYKDKTIKQAAKSALKHGHNNFKDAPAERKRQMRRGDGIARASIKLASRNESVEEANKSGDQGLRDWFGKSKSSDGKKGWVQLGGKYAGKPCARQPGQTSTPKCGSSKMKRNLNKDEEERAFRRKNRQDPNQPEKRGGAKPTNVKTEAYVAEVKDKPGKGSGKKDACYHKVKSRYSVWPSAYASGALVRCRKVGAKNWGNKSQKEEVELDEKCWDGYKQKGMKKKGNRVVPNCVAEAPQWMQPHLAKTVYKMDYKKAMPVFKTLIDRKKKESGGKLRHSLEYYAQVIAKQMPHVDARTLASMYEGYDPQKHEWGTPEGTAHMAGLTPGEKKTVCKECEGAGCSHCDYRGSHSLKEHCGCEHDEYDTWTLDDQDMAELEAEADTMSFEDMIEYGMYDIDDFEVDEDDPHSDVQITEALSVQGRMKRRFAARKNKQKLKIARNLAMRRASSPDRLKKRANRGARGMIYKRLLRGRSRAKLPPAERARLEKMIDTRFTGFISRLSARMMPNMRKAEIARLKKRRGSKPKTSKKYKAAKPKVAKSQKAKKFKVKK